MKTLKIKDLCSIQMGYSFRNGLNWTHEGLPLVQLKDITSGCVISVEELVRVPGDGLREANLIQRGDILFRSRGPMFKAAIAPVCNEKIAFAAPLLRLRVLGTTILPEYLCWFINQAEGELYLRHAAAGSSIMMINKDALGEMLVTIPNIQEQKNVIELVALKDKEAFLLKEIIEKRDRLVKAYIMEFLKGKKIF